MRRNFVRISPRVVRHMNAITGLSNLQLGKLVSVESRRRGKDRPIVRKAR